jgi:hypothetical protein
MIYENMPMMIFILAAGYLFTVYLLLALAKRTGKRISSKNDSVSASEHQSERNLRASVTEVVNSQ